MNGVSVLMAVAMAVAATPSPQLRVPPSLDRVIEEYRHGDAERALAEFKRWDVKRMAIEYEAWDARRVESPRLSPAGADTLDVAALVMLNTLAAVDLDEFGISRSPVTGGQPHYLAALRLVNALVRTRQSRTSPALPAEERKRTTALRLFSRNWYVFVTTMWLAAGQCVQAEKTARDGLGEVGPDADLFLAAGSVAETRMGPFEIGGEVSASCGEHWGPSEMSLRGTWLIHGRTRQNAQDSLERAVALDPALAEAHLRLGRVLYWGDRRRDAQREFERALAAVTSAERPFVGYLASLFLGQVFEEASEGEEAKRAYEQAIVCNPNGRAAHLARGHLLLMSGATEEAWAGVRTTFNKAVGEQDAAQDPWLTYRSGQLWQASGRVKELEAWVRQ